MNSTSDGIDKKIQERSKIRHYSVGSLPSQEIKNRIDLDKKTEQIKTHINTKKTVNNSKQKLGNSDKKETTNKNVNESISPLIQGSSKSSNFFNEFENDDIFKPKSTVLRTPPTTMQTESEGTAELVSNKRLRSEISPEMEQTCKKRQCEFDQINNSLVKSDFSQDFISQIFDNLDTINDLANKTIAKFARDDQIKLKVAHNNLHKLLTIMMFNYNSIDKENVMLKSQLVLNDLTTTAKYHSPIEKNNEADKNTYVNVLTKNMNKTHENINTNPTDNTTREKKESWKTPTTTKRHETIIRVDNVTDPKEALKQFKKEINNTNVEKGFKSVKQTKSGAIIIESFDTDQQNKLKVAVQGKEHLEIKETQNNDPMFMITGIQKGFTNEEFLEEIQRLNNEIVEDLGYSISDKIQVIAKRQCRNPAKENWILQAAPPISKWFLKRGTVFFDLVIVYVQEHYNLAQCFKCCGFGHVSKYCKGKQCCHKCGKEHYVSDCNEVVLRCPNCTKLKLNNVNHSARDKTCPSFKRRLNAFKDGINYNDFL